MKVAQCILPWPPSSLSPNGSQGDFRGKAKAARQYKADCTAILREKGRAIRRLPPGSIVSRVTVTFCPPSGVNRYDFDNMGKRMKQGFDAIAEAIGIDDGAWQSLVMQRGERSKNGGVIIGIEVAE